MTDAELLDETDVVSVARERTGGRRPDDPGPDDHYLGTHGPILAQRTGSAISMRSSVSFSESQK